jgi:hypothetical protein
MGFFDKLFGKKKEEKMPQEQRSYSMYGNYMVWTRDDGTQLKIAPVAIQGGERGDECQDCRFIYDKKLGRIFLLQDIEF